MKFHGQILKMRTEIGAPIQYYMSLSGDMLNLNQLIGRNLKLSHTGYECVNCGSSQPVYRMGFCKTCFFESPYASETIIRPELSRAHLGEEERDFEVEKQIQLAPHIVYLAYTGDVKVGVTREHQVPTRWIDQGATFALPIAKTENRYEAGMIEVALKNHLPDKTNYRKMLQDDYEDDLDLADFREKIKEYFPEEYQNFYRHDDEMVRLDYPYETPEKISVFSLDKQPEFQAKLIGIKGQYLSFEGGNQINIRAHEGYTMSLEII